MLTSTEPVYSDHCWRQPNSHSHPYAFKQQTLLFY